MVNSKDPVCFGYSPPTAISMLVSSGNKVLLLEAFRAKRLLLSCIWVALLTASFSLPAQPRTSEELPAYLEKQLPRWLERYRVPGVSLAIIREARPHWIATYGMADAGTQESLTPQAVFQAASVSKSLTAWGVMKLVSEGRIDLDEPVNRYLSRWQLPESRFNNREVTVRRLLSHTGGLPSPVAPPNYDPASRLSPEALLSQESLKVKYPPGKEFHYSNAGYTVLQLLISEVSGRSFSDYMYGAVLAPLGMQKSTFKWEDVPPEQRATAHDFLGRPAPSEFFPELAATGLNTNAADLARFVSAGMPSLRAAVRGYPVLPPQAIDEMQVPQANVSGLTYLGVNHYGLGYFVETTSRGYEVLSHSGYNPPGWTAQFFAVPKTGDGLVILTNSANGRLLINAAAQAWSYATGIGKLAITSTHRKITATTWLATIVAMAMVVWLGFRFFSDLRQGRRSLSRRKAFVRMFGLLILAGILTLCWTILPLVLNSWTPQLTSLLLWAISGVVGLVALNLLLPPKKPQELINGGNGAPETAGPDTEPEDNGEFLEN